MIAVSGCLLAAAAAGWWYTRPPPAPPPKPDDQSFEDMDRLAYEQWMQELGYVD